MFFIQIEKAGEGEKSEGGVNEEAFAEAEEDIGDFGVEKVETFVPVRPKKPVTGLCIPCKRLQEEDGQQGHKEGQQPVRVSEGP